VSSHLLLLGFLFNLLACHVDQLLFLTVDLHNPPQSSLFRTLVEQPYYWYYERIRIIMSFICPCISNLFTPFGWQPPLSLGLHPQVPCPQLPRPLVLSGAPLVALCVRLQGVSRFFLLHCLIKFSSIESSNVYVWFVVSSNTIIFHEFKFFARPYH